MHPHCDRLHLGGNDLIVPCPVIMTTMWKDQPRFAANDGQSWRYLALAPITDDRHLPAMAWAATPSELPSLQVQAQFLDSINKPTFKTTSVFYRHVCALLVAASRMNAITGHHRGHIGMNQCELWRYPYAEPHAQPSPHG